MVSLEVLTGGYFCGLWFGTDPAPVMLPHFDPMFSALLQGNFGEEGPAGRQVSVLWGGNMGSAACCRWGAGGQQTQTVHSIAQAGRCQASHMSCFFLFFF